MNKERKSEVNSTELLAVTPVFEAVQQESDVEPYYTIGLYATLKDAVDDLTDVTPPNHDGPDWEDNARIEIRKRQYGRSSTGQVVAWIEWYYDYDKCEWEFSEVIYTANK